jgi:hypothetical protein
MSPLVIRPATIRDISSIVKIRLETLSNDEISGFSAPEFANTSSTKKLLNAWDMGNKLKDGLEVFFSRR